MPNILELLAGDVEGGSPRVSIEQVNGVWCRVTRTKHAMSHAPLSDYELARHGLPRAKRFG